MSNKQESDDTLPSDETSISIQNEIENKSESINSGITEIQISILRIFDSIYSVNKMSKDLNSLEKYTQKKPKKSVSRKDKVGKSRNENSVEEHKFLSKHFCYRSRIARSAV